MEQQCNEHHIVIVLGGYKTINLAMPLFKSLLFHHPGPLYFHFIADKRARRVIPTLFDTWELPSVRYSIYELERYKDRVDWIPSKHYSSVYGLIRLAIPEILPHSVKEVLFMDTDLVVLNDISPIFDVFKGTSDSAMLAMAENISPWYTKHKNHWPARGRGFNAGVIYLQLERARKANWTNLFTTAAKEGLAKFAYGHDQDILNALVVSRPDIVVQLPCEYNFQLASSAQPGKCQKDDRLVKIVHFNSPQKLKLRSKFVAHFARSFALFESMDGYIFRLREQCGQESEISTEFKDLKENDADCEELLEAIQTKYRTHLYFNNYVSTNTTDDITLVTHLSVDRFDAFNSVLESWEGPVSVAVYCTDAELSQIEKFMKAANMGRRRKNFAMHAVFKTGNYYPINYLRNVAMNGSNTEFVYSTDSDFIPSKGLYQNLRTLVKSKMKKKVLIVPAFESSSLHKSEFPKTKEALLIEWNKGNAQPFGFNTLQVNLNASGYGKWKESEFPYEVNWNTGYELLTVIAREAAPLNDEELVGFGWNNISNYGNLHNEGYQFLMIPSAFTIHKPHSPSFEISRYKASSLYTKCSKTLLSHFANNSNLRILAQNNTLK